MSIHYSTRFKEVKTFIKKYKIEVLLLQEVKKVANRPFNGAEGLIYSIKTEMKEGIGIYLDPEPRFNVIDIKTKKSNLQYNIANMR
jgi:hypothetical protein